jgi:hypothetical protein
VTYTIYKCIDGILQRVGTFAFRGKWHTSVRALSIAFWTKYPNIPKSERSLYYCASRRRLMGVWTDNEPLPMETEDEDDGK